VLAEEAIPRYLSRSNLDRINLGEGIKTLIRVSCRSLGEWNKYWLEDGRRKYIFFMKEEMICDTT